MLSKRVLKFFLLLLTFTLASSVQAQFRSATLGVDGLTCSACSFGTEKSIRKLEFVEDVKMDLNKNIAEITFKKDSKVDIDALVKKVYDAGFSVRFVQAVFNFDHVNAAPNTCFLYNNDQYQFISSDSKPLTGEVKLNFIAKTYVPDKQLKKWKKQLKPACQAANGKVYFVTIEA